MLSNPIEKIKQETFDKSPKIDDSISVKDKQTDIEALYSNFLYNGSETNKKYHEDAIKTAQLTLKCAMFLFIGVTLFICYVIFKLLNKDNLDFVQAAIPLTSSVLADLLSATIIFTMKSWLQSKNKYFEESIRGEELSKIIGLIRNMKDGAAKDSMIAKIVNNYCANSKKDNKPSD